MLHGVILYRGSLIWFKGELFYYSTMTILNFTSDTQKDVLLISIHHASVDEFRLKIGTNESRILKNTLVRSKFDLRLLVTGSELMFFNGREVIAKLSFRDLWTDWGTASIILSSKLNVTTEGYFDLERLTWGGRQGGYNSPSYFANLTSNGLQPGGYNINTVFTVLKDPGLIFFNLSKISALKISKPKSAWSPKVREKIIDF